MATGRSVNGYSGKPDCMKLYSLGVSVPNLPRLTSLVPPFEVDGLLVSDEQMLTDEETELLAVYRRYGRPVGGRETDFEGMPRTNYQPINCSFYDNFEAAIVRRRQVDIAYLLPDDGVKEVKVQLKDLKTRLTEEYVQLANEQWLRLDRIVRVDGVPAGESCSF